MSVSTVSNRSIRLQGVFRALHASATHSPPANAFSSAMWTSMTSLRTSPPSLRYPEESDLSPSRCCYAILCRPRSCGGGPRDKRRAIGRSSNPAKKRLPRLRGCVLARRLEREGLTCNVVLQEGRELAPRQGGAAVARRLVELRPAFEQGAAPRNVGLQIREHVLELG